MVSENSYNERREGYGEPQSLRDSAAFNAAASRWEVGRSRTFIRKIIRKGKCVVQPCTAPEMVCRPVKPRGIVIFNQV